jgi:hypothetical protein
MGVPGWTPSEFSIPVIGAEGGKGPLTNRLFSIFGRDAVGLEQNGTIPSNAKSLDSVSIC